LFKALIIQSLYNLSDDQLEYQIVDRASFKRFLGLKKSDKVPDSKTFWLFREQLIEKGVILGLFKIFNETLDAAGVLSNQGKIVDASFVEAPRQRNTTSLTISFMVASSFITVNFQGWMFLPLGALIPHFRINSSCSSVTGSVVYALSEYPESSTLVTQLSVAWPNNLETAKNAITSNDNFVFMSN
jgi:IS5 family transposase